MIYVTGDTHSDVTRLSEEVFVEQCEMTKDDYVVILGDFGLIWEYKGETRDERYCLDWLNDAPFTTLFIDGNHENFTRLYGYPVKEWHGGHVHEIRPSVLHLMRGEIFDIDGASCFAFGGAPSHDIKGLATQEKIEADYAAGILDPKDPRFGDQLAVIQHLNQYNLARPYRIKGQTWWPEEIASEEEMQRGLDNLEKHGNKVDFVFSHDGPSSTIAIGWMGAYKPNPQSLYLEKVRCQIEYNAWLFGHYHTNRRINEKEICLYDQITQIW